MFIYIIHSKIVQTHLVFMLSLIALRNNKRISEVKEVRGKGNRVSQGFCKIVVLVLAPG